MTCFKELERYKVDKFVSPSAIECLAEAELKSDNVKNRKKLSKLISYYMEEDQWRSYAILRNFLTIKFLNDQNQNLVCLNDEVFVDESLSCPSFFDTPILIKAISK